MLQIKNETRWSLVDVKKWSNIKVELEFLKNECLYFSIMYNSMHVVPDIHGEVIVIKNISCYCLDAFWFSFTHTK